MKNFNPRHLRSKYSNRSGSSDQSKSRAFRRCKQISDRYIHQSASALESPALANGYAQYCAVTGEGKGFRRTAK